MTFGGWLLHNDMIITPEKWKGLCQPGSTLYYKVGGPCKEG
jgi:hypothetical protein